MPRASGSKLKNLLENRQTLESFCAKGKKKDLVQLAITILKKIAVLQLNGVLLGDINLNNILVFSPTEIWLVDCDSYQTGGYVCPVGDPRFTAPEIQGKKFPTFLRSTGNEQFAVAVLLFMLMVTRKHPYVQQNMESISKAIAEMEFRITEIIPMYPERVCGMQFPRAGIFTSGASCRTFSAMIFTIPSRKAADIAPKTDGWQPPSGCKSLRNIMICWTAESCNPRTRRQMRFFPFAASVPTGKNGSRHCG